MSRHRAMEKVKTALIVLLLLSLLAFAFAIWLYSTPLRWEDTSAVALLARAVGLVSEPHRTLVLPLEQNLREAAQPAQVVWTQGGSHWGIPYPDIPSDAVYNRLENLLGEALGSSQLVAEQTESAWRAALSEPNVYLEYNTAVPLGVLSLWLISEIPSLPDVPVTRLALVAMQSSVSLWYINENDGLVYTCQTALPEENIPGIIPDRVAPCRFGFETGSYPKAPRSLFFDNPPVPQAAYGVPAALNSPITDAFLTQLDISPETNARHTGNDGSTTYFGGTRQCFISTSEIIRYFVPEDAREGFSAQSDAKRQAHAATTEAAELLSHFSSLLGDARLCFLASETSPDGAEETVTFGYELAGLPVFLQDGAPATFKFRDGLLIQADIRILSFFKSQEDTLLLPTETAYLLQENLHVGADFDMKLVYAEQGGRLTIGWERTQL